jgi:hypothetical protein
MMISRGESKNSERNLLQCHLKSLIILGLYINVGKTYIHMQPNFQLSITDSFLRSSTRVIPCQINTEEHNFRLDPLMIPQNFVSL